MCICVCVCTIALKKDNVQYDNTMRTPLCTTMHAYVHILCVVRILQQNICNVTIAP